MLMAGGRRHGNPVRRLDFFLYFAAMAVDQQPGQRHQKAQVEAGHQQVQPQAQAHRSFTRLAGKSLKYVGQCGCKFSRAASQSVASP